MLYEVLGGLMVAMLLVITAPYWLRTLNNLTVKTKDKRFFQLIRFLRSLHKPLGLGLALIAILHGYLAWGSLRPHTGMLAFLSFAVTAALGGTYYKTKNKKLFRAHKIMAAVSIALLALHLLWPGALWSVFGV